jgi:hypothetical protein
VFEYRVLKNICGPKRDEATGNWRKLHTLEFHGSFSTPNIIRVIKSRIMCWVGHVERVGERRGTYKVFFGGGKPEGKNCIEDLDLDGKIILRWVFIMMRGSGPD